MSSEWVGLKLSKIIDAFSSLTEWESGVLFFTPQEACNMGLSDDYSIGHNNWQPLKILLEKKGWIHWFWRCFWFVRFHSGCTMTSHLLWKPRWVVFGAKNGMGRHRNGMFPLFNTCVQNHKISTLFYVKARQMSNAGFSYPDRFWKLCKWPLVIQ